MRLLALVLLVGGCSVSATADPGKPPPAKPAGAACGADQDALLDRARSGAAAAFIVMDAAHAVKHAREDWTAVAPACRDGRWYDAAAMMIAYAGGPIEAPGVKLATMEDVLAGALAAKADDEHVFARIAFNAALGGKPALPADACARAKAAPRATGDAAAYTCAQAAIASGDGKLAGELVTAIKHRGGFLDIDLVAARAAKLRGDAPAMKKFAAAAAKIDDGATNRAYMSGEDEKRVIAAAKAL